MCAKTVFFLDSVLCIVTEISYLKYYHNLLLFIIPYGLHSIFYIFSWQERIIKLSYLLSKYEVFLYPQADDKYCDF